MPLITNAIPTYVATFHWASAEVIGVVVVRFLLPTGRIFGNPVVLCRESCNTLLESIKRVLAEQRIRGNASREQEEECDALHTEASREAHRQLTEQEQIRERESRDRRLSEEQYQREQERIIQAQEASEQEASLRVERERLLNAAERRRRRILSNSANRLARIRDTQSVASEQQVSVIHAANAIAQVPEVRVQVEEEEAEDRKLPATPASASSAQEIPSIVQGLAQAAHPVQATSSTPWNPPFVPQESSTPDLAVLLQNNLQLQEPAAAATAPIAGHASSVAHAQEAQEEDRKLTSLPHVTAFATPAAAQEAVEAYLERWDLETPSGRAAIRAQGKEILRGVEALKKTTKHSYRHQVLGFETQDIDPLVWERVLAQQRAAQEQLQAVRDLRGQLLGACQIHGSELQEVDIRTDFDEEEDEEVLYSSDEDEQQLSAEEIRENQELLQEIAIEAGFWIIAPEAKAVQILFKAGKLLKLGKRITKGGKVLIQVADSKVGREATQLVQKMGGRVVEKGITSVIKRAGLPTSGKIRFIPRPSDVKSRKILTQGGGYVDKFGNLWRRPKVASQGKNVHWDVQLSSVGKKQLGHLSPSGSHLNVTGQGSIHH